jgi:phage terminase large subunit-like protein
LQNSKALLSQSQLDELAVLEDEFKYAWELQARSKQLPPDGDWLYWLILAGRGWGKTRTAVEFVRKRVCEENAQTILIVARSPTELREYCIEGKSGILSVFPPALKPNYQPSKSRIVFHTGAIALCYSAETPDKIRGAGIDTAWFDEFATYKYQKEIWETFVFSLREGQPKVVISTTPRNTKELKKLKDNPKTHLTRGSTYENKANLSDIFVDEVIKPYEGTRTGRQELEAEILEDVEGALWKILLIDQNRINKKDLPDLKYIVIGVDPAGSQKGDEIGIICGGLGNNGDGYILDDGSLHGTPNEWASEAIRLFNYHKANEIVPEVNYGGDMVVNTIKTLDKDGLIKVYSVRATRGKAIRAEPIVSLYEQGKIHHVGTFPELEDQMCSWSPIESKESPDRIDALVWALTRLMIEKNKGNPGLRRL